MPKPNSACRIQQKLSWQGCAQRLSSLVEPEAATVGIAEQGHFQPQILQHHLALSRIGTANQQDLNASLLKLLVGLVEFQQMRKAKRAVVLFGEDAGEGQQNGLPQIAEQPQFFTRRDVQQLKWRCNGAQWKAIGGWNG